MQQLGVLFSICLFLLSVGERSYAQDDLSNHYVSRDGTVTFDYPEQWQVLFDEEGEIILSPTGIDNIEGVTIVFTIGNQVDGSSTDDMTVIEVAENVAQFADESGATSREITALEIEKHPAARFETTDEDGAYLVLVIQFDTGYMISILQTPIGETTDWEEVYLSIVGTLNYEVASTDEPPKEELRQWATDAEATSEFSYPVWGAIQATGEPDTFKCEDATTAWTSLEPDSQETLTLYYDNAVIPTQVNIYQNLNPGAITSVQLISVEGEIITLENSADPIGNTECGEVFTLDIEDLESVVKGVMIYLDQSELGDWTEIDAVELVGFPTGLLLTRQWAVSADGSSQYGEDNWGFKQATGAPNTSESCSDSTLAWASLGFDSTEYLTLTYATPVIPTKVRIYETYTPGAILGVELSNSTTGETFSLKDSADKPGETLCPGVFIVEVNDIETPIDTVTIYFDMEIVGNWNEIDAVELLGIVPVGE